MNARKRDQGPPRGAMRLAGLGVELAAAVAGACLLGYWIDLKFHSSPWGLLICAAVGVVGGLYNMIRQSVHELFRPPRRGDGDSKGSSGGQADG